MRSRVAELIRSNIALALLCVISIGVLLLIFQRNKSVSVDSATKVISVKAADPNATPGNDQNTVDPDWSNMPAPDSFEIFTYSNQENLDEALKCSDSYAVVLIYPMAVDYRSNHAAAIYNQAFPCVDGNDLNQDISLKDLRLTASSTYYVIRANQGSSGTWYNPY